MTDLTNIQAKLLSDEAFEMEMSQATAVMRAASDYVITKNSPTAAVLAMGMTSAEIIFAYGLSLGMSREEIKEGAKALCNDIMTRLDQLQTDAIAEAMSSQEVANG